MKETFKSVILFPFLVVTLVFGGLCIAIENALDLLCEWMERHF